MELCIEGERNVKNGLHWWVLVGRRLGVVKDIRQLIAGLLWNERLAWTAPRGFEVDEMSPSAKRHCC